jgi:hypothetical protein
LLWQEAFWKLQAWRETISKQMPSIPVLCCVVKPESICWLLLTVPCAITYSFSNLVRAPHWGGRGPEKAGLPSVSGLYTSSSLQHSTKLSFSRSACSLVRHVWFDHHQQIKPKVINFEQPKLKKNFGFCVVNVGDKLMYAL